MTAAAFQPADDAVPCAYVRISDDRTGENASIARQRKLVRELAARLGIDPETIRWFEDRSKSASHGVRPAYVELLAAVRNGEASAVLVWVADRLWRNAEDQHEIGQVLGRAKLKVHAAQGNDVDFTTAEGRFTGRVVGAASSFEVERKKERVQLAAEDRARKGRFSGGARRFGYEQRDTRVHRTMDEAGNVTEMERPSGPLVLVPAEAEAVAAGYRQILGGASLNAVTRDWRARGLTGVQGGPLTPQVVREILLRPANAGLSVYRGEIVGRGEWPAIVDPEAFADVKALLGDPARRTNVGRPVIHLLSGILRCGTCGGPMLAGSKGGEGRRQNYRCRSGRELSEAKLGVHSSRGREKLDEAISAIVREYISANSGRLTSPDRTADHSVAKAVDDAAKLRGKIDAYVAQAANFDPADLAGLLRGLRKQLADIEAKIVKAAGRPATYALLRNGDIHATWAEMSTAERRTVIKETVDRVEVGTGLQGSHSGTMHNVRVFDRQGRVIFG